MKTIMLSELDFKKAKKLSEKGEVIKVIDNATHEIIFSLPEDTEELLEDLYDLQLIEEHKKESNVYIPADEFLKLLDEEIQSRSK